MVQKEKVNVARRKRRVKGKHQSRHKIWAYVCYSVGTDDGACNKSISVIRKEKRHGRKDDGAGSTGSRS